jgi:hypothetical protein
MHDQAIPPPIPITAVPGLVEGPAFMGNALGKASHMTGKAVYFDGHRAVQKGHDMGYGIPHFALPPNALMAVHTMVSKHKVITPVQSVLIDGKPLGTYVGFLGGEICCNPVSLPTGVVMLLKCTVWTQLNKDGFKAFVLQYLEDATFDMLWKKTFGKLFKWSDKSNIEMLGGFDSVKEASEQGGSFLIKRYLLRKLVDAPSNDIGKRWLFEPFFKPLLHGKHPQIGRGNRLSHEFFKK